MPIVQIHLLEGRSKEQKENLVRELTNVICQTVDVEPEQARIILSEMHRDNYSIAGTLISNK